MKLHRALVDQALQQLVFTALGWLFGILSTALRRRLAALGHCRQPLAERRAPCPQGRYGRPPACGVRAAVPGVRAGSPVQNRPGS
jgi:hypothetical protein